MFSHPTCDLWFVYIYILIKFNLKCLIKILNKMQYIYHADFSLLKLTSKCYHLKIIPMKLFLIYENPNKEDTYPIVYPYNHFLRAGQKYCQSPGGGREE